MSEGERAWPDNALARDVRFGFLQKTHTAAKRYHPQVVLNGEGISVLRSLREELRHSRAFTFSVAFVTPRAIALLKQELLEFEGEGRIITSDYLGFNSPRAFAELLNLARIGVDIRIHQARAFHPKGYIFEGEHAITALVGSANLTERALVENHEWNLKVSAAHQSDLAAQTKRLIEEEVARSAPLTAQWIEDYSRRYTASIFSAAREPAYAAPNAPELAMEVAEPAPSYGDPSAPELAEVRYLPNKMQREALAELKKLRDEGKRRAIIISATGTGKTMLSAFDVEAVNPARLLFIVHREQIIDRTIIEYQRVLRLPANNFGKLVGARKEADRRYVFATIQTLSQPSVLESFRPDDFDYIIVDESHRIGAPSYQRALKYFSPEFLVGMTATPERTDGFNIFDFFEYNVAYEIRLGRALEEGMLSPFHYYGVADVRYEDGRLIDDKSDLNVLISPERVDHLLSAIENYGQAGVLPKGLIFCGRVREAEALSEALNTRELRGSRLRTVALSGSDSNEQRLQAVSALEAGELDYILTVDVFNEGVDIPTINQIIMLRQTKSPIVFVQQLGRGLRKAADKDYLIVIDFIGNYTNNFMIPIALFGDESLNKESLRKNIIAAEEEGVIAGLSSVRFDKIAHERVLNAIANTKLASDRRLKAALEEMQSRVGGPPSLWDFWRFESVDPVVLGTARAHFPALLSALLRLELALQPHESKALELLSHEILTATRLHELEVAKCLFASSSLTTVDAEEALASRGVTASEREIQSAMEPLSLRGFREIDEARYGGGIAAFDEDGTLTLRPEIARSYEESASFRKAVDDLLKTGSALVEARYGGESRFMRGAQYSRREACRILNWPRKWAQTIFGYRVDPIARVCPIFVTLHKSSEISATTAYEDELLSRQTMRWFTRTRVTLAHRDVRAIVQNEVTLHVFVKKDDAEGIDFYYLGEATSYGAKETTMKNDDGKELPVVEMLLHFEEPIDVALYDYFHPALTN